MTNLFCHNFTHNDRTYDMGYFPLTTGNRRLNKQTCLKMTHLFILNSCIQRASTVY